MAIDYDLQLATHLGSSQVLQMLSVQNPGLAWGEDRFFLFGPSVQITATAPLALTQSVIADAFRFIPMNGERIVLQRLGGQLTFNSDHYMWEEDWLKSRLPISFERRSLPSPLM